jgi:hypothetical protein
LYDSNFIWFFTCDPYGGYEYWIDNKSDSTLFVVLRENYADKVEKITIESNSETLLKKYESINGLHDYGERFLLRYLDSLTVMTDTTSRLTIKKDYFNRDSWTYNQQKTGQTGLKKSGDNIYRLNINNEDLK